MKNTSVWVLEILRKNEWVRYCDKVYTSPKEIGKIYDMCVRPLREREIELRIAEYRNCDFTEPHTTIMGLKRQILDKINE